MLPVNSLHYADNLDVMYDIISDSVDLIYSDVLYGTGRSFNSYVDITADRQTVENHYTYRFQEMKRVLSVKGTVYIQCDYRINYILRDLLNQVFGEENFRNEIIWHYNSAPRKRSSFGNRHDTILRYTKTDNFVFNADTVRLPYSATAPRGYEKDKYYNPKGKVIGDVWEDIKILGQNDKSERVGYPTQKPIALAERIINVSSNPGDLVADFYMGSGTAMIAAKKLNRNFIGVDNSYEAFKTASERIRKTSKTT